MAALDLVLRGDPGLVEIVVRSLQVTGLAVAIACVLGLPLGAALAVGRFPGRGALVVLISALMGLPPVVVGLTAHVLLSASGPLGALGLLYTPTAMVIAQMLLVPPIVAALSRQVVADLHNEHDECLRAGRAGTLDAMATLLRDGRFGLPTAALAGLGRALVEVGAVMVVGGNIAHVTRTMTTAIALETSRGALEMALALGIVLVGLSIAINAALIGLRTRAERLAHA